MYYKIPILTGRYQELLKGTYTYKQLLQLQLQTVANSCKQPLTVTISTREFTNSYIQLQHITNNYSF
jgi:hypothetical protein